MNIKFTNYNEVRRSTKFSRSHDMERCKEGGELFHRMISQSFQYCSPIDYDVVMIAISPYMTQMLKNHAKTNYTSVMKFVMKKQPSKSSKSRKSQNITEVPHWQVCEYVRNVFRRILPRALFGSARNEKHLMKAVSSYLFTAMKEQYNLESVVAKLNLSKIVWLNVLTDEQEKVKIMLQLLRWLLVNYLNEVLSTQFFIKHCSVTHRRTFIRQSVWSSEKAKKVKKLLESGSFRLAESQEKDLKCGILQMQHVRDKFRPLFSRKHFDDEKYMYMKLNCFLEQLMLSKLGAIPNTKFQDKWFEIVKSSREKKVDLYLISCDVRDAFGSVKHDVLLQILESLCEGLPEKLKFRTFFPEKTTRYKTFCRSNKTKMYSIDLKIPDMKNYKEIRNSVKVIKLSDIKDQLKRLICQQKVVIGRKVYDVTEGVLQGFPVSATLSSLYYKHMVLNELASFMSSGILHVYADDFFYATTDKFAALTFRYKIRENIQPYNCRFNYKKTKQNFDLASFEIKNPATIMTYIGWKIDGKTLQVEPEYHSAISRHHSYKITDKNSIFTKKIHNLSTLKLDKIVLCSNNTEETLLKVMENAGLRQAYRCLVLLKSLKFTDMNSRKYLQFVLKEINVINSKIVSKTLRVRNENSNKLLRLRLHNALLKGYESVFRVRKHAFVKLLRQLKKRMTGCEKALKAAKSKSE